MRDSVLAPPRPALLPLLARGVGYDIGGARILEACDLTLSGEGVTVIMGPNGAGKSVLLRLLHGLLVPTRGTIAWGGIADPARFRARQAMVFQKPVLLRRTAAANVDFALRARGGDDPARRDALLAHVGLAAAARRPARALSGGEQQRLALARALASSPQVLFLDEPTANLDPASTALIETIVRGVAALGTAVVFVTHDAAQARRLAGDVVFLHRGRVAAHSPAAPFFDAPPCAAARDYLAGKLVV